MGTTTITSHCHTRVAFTPNRVETARLLSQMCGDTTVRHAQRTRSNSGITISEPETSRPLLTTDEVMRLPEDAALVFSSGAPAAWASKLRYYRNPEFLRRTKIPPPDTSDRLPVAASSQGGVEEDATKSDSEKLL